MEPSGWQHVLQWAALGQQYAASQRTSVTQGASPMAPAGTPRNSPPAPPVGKPRPTQLLPSQAKPGPARPQPSQQQHIPFLPASMVAPPPGEEEPSLARGDRPLLAFFFHTRRFSRAPEAKLLVAICYNSLLDEAVFNMFYHLLLSAVSLLLFAAVLQLWHCYLLQLACEWRVFAAIFF